MRYFWILRFSDQLLATEHTESTEEVDPYLLYLCALGLLCGTFILAIKVRRPPPNQHRAAVSVVNHAMSEEDDAILRDGASLRVPSIIGG